jgi:hypothetical protein
MMHASFASAFGMVSVMDGPALMSFAHFVAYSQISRFQGSHYHQMHIACMSTLIRSQHDYESVDPTPDLSLYMTGLLSIAIYVWRFILEYLLYRLNFSEGLRGKIVYLPKFWVDDLRDQAQKELEDRTKFSGVRLNYSK